MHTFTRLSLICNWHICFTFNLICTNRREGILKNQTWLSSLNKRLCLVVMFKTTFAWSSIRSTLQIKSLCAWSVTACKYPQNSWRDLVDLYFGNSTFVNHTLLRFGHIICNAKLFTQSFLKRNNQGLLVWRCLRFRKWHILAKFVWTERFRHLTMLHLRVDLLIIFQLILLNLIFVFLFDFSHYLLS